MEDGDGIRIPISFRGKNTFRRLFYYPEVDLTGCVVSFQIRDLDVAGLPTTLRLGLTSGFEPQLTLSQIASAETIDGKTLPAGTWLVTLELSAATTEAIPFGDYLYEWKIIWPAVGDVSRKEPIAWGPLKRLKTINDA